MARPRRVVAPVAPPVSLEDLKRHGRILEDDLDAAMSDYIDAATQRLDGYRGLLGRCMVDQTWEQPFARWQRCLRLPFPDVHPGSVILTCRVPGGVETLEAANYEVIDTDRGTDLRFVPGAVLPSLDTAPALPITARFEAGYGEADEIPRDLKVAVMILAAHLEQDPAGASQLPAAVDDLISNHRWTSL